jgi:poly(3-hydroxybutyrate) depolymerase
MRRSLVFVFIALFAGFARAADDADVVVRKWLALAPVDVAARRTLKPDAVFAKYLLDRTAAPPKEGEEIVGTLGKPAKWTTRDAATSADPKKDGFVGGDDVEIGWAYASVPSGEDRVVVAKLEGAQTLFVGGAGFVGDVYQLGDAGVPVALKKGANDVYVGGTRGAFRLTLVRPESAIPGSRIAWLHDVTRDRNRTVEPDELEGERPLPRSTRLLNVTNSSITPPEASDPRFVPLGVRTLVDEHPGVLVEYRDGKPMPRETVKPGLPYRRTFISDIDGSVQSYALVPPEPSDIDKSKIGLVLSLHGANVECMDQAKSYAPKPDFWIVCPTNRGRFGFDWQDWGRLDAYEVLADALNVTGVDPRRVYLTGHSMGGHGTWHLAANDPGRFLAIAPSAGWGSFETYAPQSQVMSPLAWMWRAADGASRTLDLAGNLAQIPTYVLHGADDDNVPLGEAQRMVDAVTRAGGKPEFHVEPGAGHWWDKDKEKPGADCVDWPGIWELFRKTQPTEKPAKEFTFTAMEEPGPVWGLHDFTVSQLIDYGRPFRVSARLDESRREWVVSTENVRRFAYPSSFAARIDGSRVEIDPAESMLFRAAAGWREEGSPGGEKIGYVSGPFKRAFTNEFVLVYGTAGDEAETRELLEKSRHDSEIWAYRANGDANLMSDADFLKGDFKDRNVIVYGNADTNRAWSAVFDDDCPIVARRGAMTVNGAKHEGVLAAAFVRPRKGSDVALAAAFADTGAKATRLFYQFPVFVSGVGIPDYVVFGPGFLHEFDGDVRAAGWFDYAWRMK